MLLRLAYLSVTNAFALLRLLLISERLRPVITTQEIRGEFLVHRPTARYRPKGAGM